MDFSKSSTSLSILYAILVVLIATVSLPKETSSAPVTQQQIGKENTTYMSELIAHVKNQSCIYPLESDIGVGTVLYNKINSLCMNKAAWVKTKSGSEWLCVTVADVVDKICNKTNESHSLQEKVNQESASLKNEIASLKHISSSSFCDSLVNGEETPKQDELPKEIQPFYGAFIVKSDKDEATDCSAVCSNNPVKEIKGDEDFKINPLCILFKKGYSLLRELEVDRKEQEKTDSKSAMSSAAVKLPEGGASNTKNNTNNPASLTLQKQHENSADSQDSNAVGEIGQKSVASSSTERTTKLESELHKSIVSVEPTASKDQKQSLVPEDSVSGRPNSKSPAKVLDTESKSSVVVSSSTSTTSTPSSANIPISVNDEDEMPSPPLANVDRISPSLVPKDDKNKKDGTEKKKTEEKSQVKDTPKSEKTDDEDVNLKSAVEPEYTDNSEDDNFPVGKLNEDENFNLDNADSRDQKTDSIRVSKTKYNENKKELEMETVQIQKGSNGGSISVAYTESLDLEDNGGYFNYFLFFVTLLLLCLVVFHNKRRLLAYVVEGRKPRGSRSRTRRRSSSTSYRRLENNFE